ncbi:MAG: hypothetical protein ACRD2H_08835 [Terriglobales bacterium]
MKAVLLLGCAPLLVVALAAQKPLARVSLDALHWSLVDLPNSAQAVASHAGVLWAGGAAGSLERSDDGGRSWFKVREGSPAESISTIHFVTSQLGFASGPGLWLWTTDGGKSWHNRRGSPPLGVTSLVFADAAHGLAAGPDGVYLALPRGKASASLLPAVRWMAIARADGNKPLAAVLGIAALDSSRFAMLLERVLKSKPCPLVAPAPRQTILATADGGHTWHEIAIHDENLRTLTASLGKYWLFGHAIQSGAPFAAESSDGIHWNKGATRVPYASCQEQGCWIGARWWADPFAGPGLLAALPPLAHVPGRWARAGGTVCIADNVLRCALAQSASALPSQAELRPPRVEIGAPACQSCPLPAALAGGAFRGEAIVNFFGDRNGSVAEARLQCASSKELGKLAYAAVSHWRFFPVRVQGQSLPIAGAVSIWFPPGGSQPEPSAPPANHS